MFWHDEDPGSQTEQDIRISIDVYSLLIVYVFGVHVYQGSQTSISE